MKKLESLKHEKFKVSEDELLQIKGGYGGGGMSMDTSVDQSTTHLSGGGTAADSKVTDICID